ncbi:MAG: hypothetical protein QOD39_2640 [Mycobacterium sp.]|nr:hypothetical protein [Mycobacterium sp.]
MLPTEQFEPDNETGTDGIAPGDLDRALLGGEPARVGRFVYNYDRDSWVWSSAVAHMHGYEPGEVQPTTALVLSHKHPDDLAQVKGLLKRSSAPFSSRHRIRTKAGEERTVVVVGEIVKDSNDEVVATRGFYIDVTDAVEAQIQRSLGEQLDVIVPNRAAIEQAKGMLMAVYRLDADAAFDILRWRSQELNIKLHDVAAEIVNQLPTMLGLPIEARTPIDHFLVTLSNP